MQAILEASLRYGVGFSGCVRGVCERDEVTAFAALFSESTARALVAVPAEREAELLELATEAGVAAMVIGETGGDAIIHEGEHTGDEPVAIPLSEAREAFEGTLPALFG
jgi:phosphoribosylformylglycinamidine synthase